MGAEREVIDRCFLAPEVVYPDLGVGHTAAVARLDVRFVLLIAVAFCWTWPWGTLAGRGGRVGRSWGGSTHDVPFPYGAS